MATTIGTAKPPVKPGWSGAGNGNGSGGWNGDGRGGGRGQPRNGIVGMWFALAGIMMLFMAMTSAYVVRRGLDPDWQAIRMPALALVNVAVLLASSVALELARRRQDRRAADRWLFLTWSLGLAFLAGQLVVWRQLAEAGLYLSTNAHSSFFYVLTALHGAHLCGGLLALSWLMWMPSAKMALSAGGSLGLIRGPASAADRDRWIRVAALYWHFMDGLWVYLLLLLFAFK